MRLVKHLNESFASIDDTLEIIKKKCKPFLKEWLPIYKSDVDLILYRGSDSLGKYGEKNVRQDRKTMSTPQLYSDYIDDIFYKKYKVRPRKQSIFCSGSDYVAESYGYPYIIFPVGQYKYLWSVAVEDLLINLSRIGMSGKYNTRNMTEVPYDHKKMIDIMMKSYSTKNLKKALKSENEIMVICKSFIYLDTTYIDVLDNL